VTNHPRKERGQGHVTILKYAWGLNRISIELPKRSRQILHTDWLYQVLALRWQTNLKKGVARFTWPILKF